MDIIEEMKKWYWDVVLDIAACRNLEIRSKEVDEIIQEIRIKRDGAVAKGEPYKGFDDLINEIYFLKYEILERI